VFGPAQETSLRFEYRRGATFTIEGDELGNTKRFAFTASIYDNLVYRPEDGYDFTNVHWDFAPDHAQWWTYDTRPIAVAFFSSEPRTPRAGGTLTLRMTALHTRSGGAVVTAKTGCAAWIHGKRLKPSTRSFAHRQALCVFGLPLQAKGKRVRATITIRSGGNAVTRSISARIG
jgi:hypothetical protein